MSRGLLLIDESMYRGNKDWLLNGEGEMHEKEDVAQSAKVLADIYALANKLSEEEQLYILDVIKTYKKHFQR